MLEVLDKVKGDTSKLKELTLFYLIEKKKLTAISLLSDMLLRKVNILVAFFILIFII
jgi:hypothetical protein